MGTEEKLVGDNYFREELFSKLNELREENVLCDATLRIEGQDFAVHRCVLSAASPYFRSLFTSGFKENQNNIVELQEIKSAAASKALRFIYSGEALVNASNAQDLLRTADYLIIPSLKTKVSEYLKESIDVTNCLALESLAIQLGCESLEKAAVAFKLQNFVSVVRSEDFKALDFEKIKELVSHDEIIVSKEEDVYEAVVAWVKHDVLSRECLFPDLLKCLRLFSMSKYSLWEILKEELVIKSNTCTSILQEGMAFFLFPDNFLAMSLKPRTCLNSNEAVIILTGGHNGTDLSQQEATNNTYGFLLSKNLWLSLPIMPFPRTCHGAAVCCGQLYVLGGKPSGPVFSFNPKQNKWISSVEELPTRLHCTVTACNEELYIIGGDDYWNSVDKYSPIHDEWEEITSMKTGRSAHCAVAMGNLIYILAGDDGEVMHKTTECFDPLTVQWIDKPRMINARKYAGAAASCGKIFIVGGYNDMACKTLEASCEMFDPAVDQWSLVSSPVVPRAACGIVGFEGHVYLFGGENAESKLAIVEYYDVQNDKWEQIGAMPESVTCVQATVLPLAKKYYDDDDDNEDGGSMISWPLEVDENDDDDVDEEDGDNDDDNDGDIEDDDEEVDNDDDLHD